MRRGTWPEGPLDRTAVYRRVEGIVAHTVGGETILVRAEGGAADMRSAHSLNGSAGAVWRWLDGEVALGVLADRLVRTYRIERTAAEADLAELITGLAEAGLIRPVG